MTDKAEIFSKLYSYIGEKMPFNKGTTFQSIAKEVELDSRTVEKMLNIKSVKRLLYKDFCLEYLPLEKRKYILIKRMRR